MEKLVVRSCLLSLVVAAALVYGCSSSTKHPPPIGECPVGEPCGAGGGGVGGGGPEGGSPEGGSDATTDGANHAGDAAPDANRMDSSPMSDGGGVD